MHFGQVLLRELTEFLRKVEEVRDLLIDIEKSDSRQMPRIQDICGSKAYNDILYGFLQANSEWDGVQGHLRYLPKKFINYSKLGAALGLSRQTVSKKFQNLIDLGLVVQQEDRYELVILSREIAALIPSATLNILVNTLNERAISTYIYLLWQFLWHDMQEYLFTLNEIKKFLGICYTTRSNDDTIQDILFVLQKIGLIEYELSTLEKKEGDTSDIKTIYKIINVSNYIEKENC